MPEAGRLPQFLVALEMSTPIAYLDGQLIPRREAGLPLCDLGVVGGVAVAELLRTFRHAPFRLSEHFARLEQSLSLVGLLPRESLADLVARTRDVVAFNTALIDPADDLGVIVFVTAGWNPTYVGLPAAREHGCTVGIHTFPLQYPSWRDKYDTGVALATCPHPALPSSVVDRRIKSRSRMHWHLVDRAVKAQDPSALGLVLDEDSFVTETAAANLVAVLDHKLIAPPAGAALEGVSLQVTSELAEQAGLVWQRRPLHRSELDAATEILLTSTPMSLLPACQLDGQAVGSGSPGPVFQQLMQAWNAATGIDHLQQAQRPALPW